MHLTFDHNFDKCRPIFKILSLTDSQGNCLCNYYRAYYLTFSVLLHYLVKNYDYSCGRFQWHISCETWIHLAIYEATLIAQVWILWIYNLENSAALLKRASMVSANWSSGWLMCNMGCSRQSLMQLALVYGINFWEFVFVSKKDVLSLAWTFRLFIR